MIGSKFSSGLSLSVLCETLETRSLFTSVALDPAFAGGIVQTNFGGTEESASSVIVLKDGRALVSGYSQQNDGVHGVLAAYNKDGSLSSAFDGDGKLILSAAVTSQLGGGSPGILQTPDGGILLVGPNKVLKLKLNGTTDTSYGQSGFASLLPSQNGNGDYLLTSSTQLNDGTFREISYDSVAGTLRIQDLSATGAVTRSLSKNVALAAGLVQLNIDATGITFANTAYNFVSNKVYRFNFDLTPMTSFGTNGVVDLQPAFDAWANTKTPWTQTYGDPISGIPTDLSLGGFYDAKLGIGIAGRVSEISDKTTTTYPQGLSEPYTQIDFQISADGKTISVDSGPVKGTLLAHTTYDPYDGTGEDGFEFGGTFTTTAGQRVNFDAEPGFGDYSQSNESIAGSSDGGFFVIGNGAADANPNHNGFLVTHTAPLANAANTATITGTLFNDDDGDTYFESYRETVNAGKTVFLDTNNNGKLDSGERTTTTTQYGRYQFSNVAPGTYRVRRVLPSGYQITTPANVVKVTNGDIGLLNIGSTARGLITATVKVDGTPTYANVFIDANKNGLLDQGETTFNATDNGVFQTALPAGTYRVAVVPPDGTVVANNSAAFYDLTVGQALQTSIAFNFTKPVTPGQVKGVVYVKNNPGQTPIGISNDLLFVDLNKNGVLDGNEQSVLTAADGSYSFSLQPGSYRIVAQKPASENPITYPSGFADVNVTSGQVLNVSWQFADNGAYPSKITGTLFNDDNFNGVLDNNETTNGNRTVYIDANHNGKLDAGEKQVQTDNNGKYLFTGLAPGSYDIKRVLPSGSYRITTSTQPVQLAAGQTVVFDIGSTSRPA